MDEIVQNGSSVGAEALLSHSHEDFIKLCVLSTSDTLTGEEWAQLKAHLSDCPSCREIKRQYDLLVSQDMPLLAAAATPDTRSQQSSGSWSQDEAEKALMGTISGETTQYGSRTSEPSKTSKWQRIRHYVLAALILLTCGALLYELGFSWEHRREREVSPARIATRSLIPSGASNPASVSEPESSEQRDQLIQLGTQLRRQLAELDRLKAEKLQLQKELAARADALNRGKQDRATLDDRIAMADSDLNVLHDRLSLSLNRESQKDEELAALRGQVDVLDNALHQRDRTAAQDAELLTHDRDIRDLIGARNLYIAEIYDVAKTGDTQKPFGRVFYTKDKSLIFYGYDLDQQPGLKNASTFQAWGRGGSNEHDVSLGLFYQDDANKKRWVLKFNDAKTLARLDAVFVTVEPKGGSDKPSGKPLLFTYLRLDPNHP